MGQQSSRKKSTGSLSPGNQYWLQMHHWGVFANQWYRWGATLPIKAAKCVHHPPRLYLLDMFWPKMGQQSCMNKRIGTLPLWATRLAPNTTNPGSRAPWSCACNAHYAATWDEEKWTVHLSTGRMRCLALPCQPWGVCYIGNNTTPVPIRYRRGFGKYLHVGAGQRKTRSGYFREHPGWSYHIYIMP